MTTSGLARRTAILLATTILAVAGTVGIATETAYAQNAQQQVYDFDIPAKPIRQAMNDIGRIAGLAVVFDETQAASAVGRPVRGSMTASQAVAALLDGSGIQHRFTNSSTVAISDPSRSGGVTGAADSTVLPTIIISGKTGRNPFGTGYDSDTPYETAGSVHYMDEQQVEQRRGTSTGDFLSGIPGVTVGDSRNSGAVDVNIRGMQGQGRVPVVVDGASQEATVYRGYNGSASRSYVDPDFISEVAIEKGASMGADATGASGGVVRMSTIGVKDILLPGKSFGMRVKGGFNTNSSSPEIGAFGGYQGGQNFASGGMDRPGFLKPTGGSGSVALAGTSEYVDIVAAYAKRRTGNYHAGKNGSDGARAAFVPNQYGTLAWQNVGLSPFRAGEEVPNTSTDNESWLLKGTFRLPYDQTLELGWNRYSSKYGEIFTTQLINAYPYQSLLNTIDLDTYTARYRWNPSGNDLIDLKIDAFRSEVDLRSNGINRLYYPSFGWDIWTPSNIFIGSERNGLTLSNTSRFSLGSSDFKLEYGGAYTKENIGYPDGTDESDVAWKPRQGWRKEASAFTSLEWKPIEWLKLDGGLRYSSFETFDKLESGSQNANHSGNGWSPVASVTVEPLKGLQVYGKYGSVLRAPSLFENLMMPGFTTATQLAVDPERARTVEVGLNHVQESLFLEGDRLRFHAAYFDNHIDNYITRANVQYGTNSFGNPLYSLSRVNLDYAKMRGFEISADYDTGQYFGGIAWNHYTHTMFCVPEDVGLISGVSHCAPGGIQNSWALLHVPPKDSVTLNLGARFFDDRLTIGGRLTYTGKRMVEGIGDGSTFGSGEIQPPVWKPYTLIDLNASYKINDHASFDLAVDNLTDRYHMDALTGTLMPGPGRTIRGSLTVKF